GQTFAMFFGAGRELDAFVTAFRIPNLLRDLFAEGALSAAFVTTFTQRFEREGEHAAWRLANLVVNGLALVVGALTLLGIWFAPTLVAAIAPGFADITGRCPPIPRSPRERWPGWRSARSSVACSSCSCRCPRSPGSASATGRSSGSPTRACGRCSA